MTWINFYHWCHCRWQCKHNESCNQPPIKSHMDPTDELIQRKTWWVNSTVILPWKFLPQNKSFSKHLFVIVNGVKSYQCGCTKTDDIWLKKDWGYIIKKNRKKLTRIIRGKKNSSWTHVQLLCTFQHRLVFPDNRTRRLQWIKSKSIWIILQIKQ